MIFYIYNRWGDQIGTLQDIVSAVHKDEINGEDSLSISFIGSGLIKGQRIVWKDKFGYWHEHTVGDITVSHVGGAIMTTAYCENSIAELVTDYIVEKKPSGNAVRLLQVALENSRWEVGTVDIASETVKTSWYHISAYEALQDIVSLMGGEVSTTITLNQDFVVTRKINLVSHRGGTSERRFTYGRNLASIERVIDPDDVCTALYGYGKGIPKYDDEGEATGGYTRRITFEDINKGQAWVGDEEAKLIWGLPDGKGGVKHTFGKVEFDDCEDPKELLELTKEALKIYSKPRVRYTGNVVALAKAGFTNGEDVMTGDDVFLFDKPLNDKISGRVLCVERDLLNETNTQITLGNLASSFIDSLHDQKVDLAALRNRSARWDGAARANQAWLDAMMSNMSSYFDQEGGYVEMDPATGITVYNKAKENNPDKVIQINGAGFRIANSKNSNGSWRWRTFGTGDGFVADEIVTGTLYCGDPKTTGNVLDLKSGTISLNKGIIQDLTGDNYWNMGTGQFRLAASTTIGGKTIKETIEDNMTQKAVFDSLTNNGKVKTITMDSNGDLYINATYIATGVLTDINETNKWDLNRGVLTTNSMIADNMTANNIKANGDFICGNPNGEHLQFVDGQLRGYNRTTMYGAIDFSTKLIGGSQSDPALNIWANGGIVFSAPALAVATGSGNNNTILGSTTVATFYECQPGDDGCTIFNAGYLRFYEGLCVGSTIRVG